MTNAVKDYNGLPIASIKDINGLAAASIKDINGVSFSVASGGTWVSDNFSGGTLDSSKWTAHIATSGTISVVSAELQLTRSAASTVNYMDSVSTQNSGIIFCQSYDSWDNNSPNEDLAGIMITSSAGGPPHGAWSQYSASITGRSTGGNYRLKVMTATSQYDLSTAITKGKEIKVTYDTSNNQIKFWYWNVSAWTQMGTTQTFNILNGGNIKFLTWYDNLNTFINGIERRDNIYFGTIAADYSTHYPS